MKLGSNHVTWPFPASFFGDEWGGCLKVQKICSTDYTTDALKGRKKRERGAESEQFGNQRRDDHQVLKEMTAKRSPLEWPSPKCHFPWSFYRITVCTLSFVHNSRSKLAKGTRKRSAQLIIIISRGNNVNV
jgi:hypothetical protein